MDKRSNVFLKPVTYYSNRFCKTVLRFKAFAVSRFDLDFWEWVVEIEWYTYWKATYFVMAAMFLKVTSYCSGVSMHIYN